MKERSIHFSPNMAQAVADGIKSQSCQIIKPQPTWRDAVSDGLGGMQAQQCGKVDSSGNIRVYECPFGTNGSRLWVREGFWDHSASAGLHEDPSMVEYRANPWERKSDDDVGGWMPSRSMPRWASRSTVEITTLTIERVSSLTHEDARDEGVKQPSKFGFLSGNDWRGAFKAHWNAKHTRPKPVLGTQDDRKTVMSYVSYPFDGPSELREHRGLPWHIMANPWVWAIGFKKLEQRRD